MDASSNAGLLYADVADQGTFYKSGSTNVVPNGISSAGAHLGFDASRSEDIFGGSMTVQPSSLRLLPCIKS